MWKELVLLGFVLGTEAFHRTRQADPLCVDCHTSWKLMFENDKNGATVSGNRASLLQAVKFGADVKVVIPDWDAQYRLQNYQTIHSGLCGQSIFNLATKDFKTLADEAKWRFTLFCTTGDVDISSWFVGKHEQHSDTRLKIGLQWFVRFNSAKDPVVSIRKDGTIRKGSILAAKNAVDIGADIRVVSKSGNKVYSTRFDNVEYRMNKEGNVDVISGLAIWHVTQKKENNDHYVFTNHKTSWQMSLWPTTSKVDFIEWLVGEHLSPSDTLKVKNQVWYADPCWTLAYHYDENGTAIQGSFEFLRSALEMGHRVKAVFGKEGILDRSIEPDMVLIFAKDTGETIVQGMFLNNISKDSVLTINDDTFWFWQIYIRTTGRVTVYTWDVGRHVSQGKFDFFAEVKWFIDTRTYISKYANDGSGNTVSGSKQALVNSFKAGADIRLKFDLPVNLPFLFETILITPDQIKTSVDNNNTLQISSIHVRASDANPSSQPNSSVWWFNMATTTGKLDVSRWTVGKFEDRGHNSFQSNMNWFANS